MYAPRLGVVNCFDGVALFWFWPTTVSEAKPRPPPHTRSIVFGVGDAENNATRVRRRARLAFTDSTRL